MRILALLILLEWTTMAAMMPSTNLYNWVPGVTVGVYGGIPNRTTIYTNLAPLDDSDYLRLSNSIAGCPSNQVVQLSAGIFNITNFPGFIGVSGMTLRGTNGTILNFTNHPGSAAGMMYFFKSQGLTTRVLMTADVPQGGTNVTLESVTGISTNRLITLYTRDQETNVIFAPNDLQFTNVHYHVAHVRDISGSTITFWPPTPWAFKTNLGANAQALTTLPLSFTGVENLKIVKSTNYVQNFSFQMFNTYSCWIKNVEMDRADNTHIYTVGTLFTEIRDSFIHDTSSGTDGYGVATHDKNTGALVENNAFEGLYHSVIAGQMTASVIAYNFATNSIFPNFQTQDFNGNHSQANMFNLWEGNIGNGFNSDSYHGGSFANTIFRNRFHGLHPTLTANRMMVALKRASYWYNVVGNVLGDPSWSTGPTVQYEMSGFPNYTNQPVIYVIGYPHVGNNGYTPGAPKGPYGYVPDGEESDLDTNVINRLTRHYNYDFFTQGIVLDPGISDTNLVNSMFRTATPQYFTDTGKAWPPFSPLSPNAALPSNLPAYQTWFVAGSSAAVTLTGNVTISGTTIIQ